jgi:hypothetical protein
MLVACFFIYKYFYGFDYGKLGKCLLSLALIASLAMPHIINYFDFENYD